MCEGQDEDNSLTAATGPEEGTKQCRGQEREEVLFCWEYIKRMRISRMSVCVCLNIRKKYVLSNYGI